jgi:hypothetical protein
MSKKDIALKELKAASLSLSQKVNEIYSLKKSLK